MVDVASLLPPASATPLERTIEQASAPEPRVGPGVVAIPGIKGDQLPTWLPFLLWERGLSALTPFVPNPYTLLDEGPAWLLDQGTFAAVARGLGWLGHSATIHESPTRRIWWNSFQLALDSIPGTDALLDSIDRITDLSVFARSDFRRAWHGYNGPALDGDYSIGDDSIGDDESGVRLRVGGPKWSFGRLTEVDAVLTEAEGTALGIWVPPAEGASLAWEDVAVSWDDAAFAWESDAALQRATSLATLMSEMPVLVGFFDQDGGAIGYRRPRAFVRVKSALSGPYAHGGIPYAPADDGSALFVDAWTDFSDGTGEAVASIALLFEPVVDPSVPPGRLWISPAMVSGGVRVAERLIAFPLRATVRERTSFLLRY